MNKIIKLINIGDIKLFYIFNNGFKCNVLDKTMPIFTKLGGAFFAITTSFIFILIGKNEIRRMGLQCFITLITSHICVHYLKKVFTRPRPFLNLVDAHTFYIQLYDYSFPSGHTTAAFSMALTLTLYFPIFSFIFLSVAFIIGLSRIYLGAHYPSDVLVGMVIGIIFALVNHILLS